MTPTASAESDYKRLLDRQKKLLQRQVELVQEGENLRSRSQMVGDLPRQIDEIADELAALVPQMKAARRTAGAEAATQLADNRDYQVTLANAVNVLQPLIMLADATALLRGQNAMLPPLPQRLSLLIEEGRAYLGELARIGATKEGYHGKDNQD